MSDYRCMQWTVKTACAHLTGRGFGLLSDGYIFVPENVFPNPDDVEAANYLFENGFVGFAYEAVRYEYVH